MSNTETSKLENRVAKLERQNRSLFLLLFVIIAGCATVASEQSSEVFANEGDIVDVVKTRSLQVYSGDDELVFDVKPLPDDKGAHVALYAGHDMMSYWTCSQEGSDFAMYEKWPYNLSGWFAPSIWLSTATDNSNITILGREHGNIRIGYSEIYDDTDALIGIIGPGDKERIIKANNE